MPALFGLTKALLSFTVIAILAIGAFFSDKPEEVPPITEKNAEQSPSIVPVTLNTEPPTSEETPKIRNETAPEEKAGDIDTGSPLPDSIQPKEDNTSDGSQQNTEPTEEVPSTPPIQKEIPPTTIQQGTFEKINEVARESAVNIFCEMRGNGTLKTITGSGTIIDPRGIILTNAHIAQFFLLTDYPQKAATSCSIRTGNLAKVSYKAELLYIPITWTQAHSNDINVTLPLGTGEGDYALIYITEPTDESAELPEAFPYLHLNTSEEAVEPKESVLVASYPALVSDINAIKNNLYLVSTLTQIGTLFTFTENSLDLFGLDGNIAAHRGSSGGAVVNTKGELVGLIVTSTNDTLVLNRELRALTPSYISRDMQKENGTTLTQLLFGDIGLRAKGFNLTVAPLLTKLLINAIANGN